MFASLDIMENAGLLDHIIEAASHGDEFDAEWIDAGNAAVARLADAAEKNRADLVLGTLDSISGAWFRRDAAPSMKVWLQRRTGMDGAEAARIIHYANLLRRLPQLEAALRQRQTTIGHVAELAAMATEPRENSLQRFAEQLVCGAVDFGVEEYRRLCQHWAALTDEHLAEPTASDAGWFTLQPTLFGEADVRGHLTADQANAVGEALNSANGPDPADAPVQRTLRQRNADALADMATSFLGGGTSGPTAGPPPDHKAGDAPPSPRRGVRPTGIVLIGLDTLVDHSPSHDTLDGPQFTLTSLQRDLLGQGPLPRAVAELLTCDSALRRLVVDPDGQPLDLGRATPTVSGSQRHALVVRDRGCMFPHCDRPAHWCDAHHLQHWARGGPTDLGNLVLLCRFHHRLIHGPDWDLERHPVTGVVTAIRSDGAIYRRDRWGCVLPDTRGDPPLS